MIKRILFIVLVVLSVFSFNCLYAASMNTAKDESKEVVDSNASVGNVQDAMKAFKNLSATEKKSRFKEMKKALKQFKAERKAGGGPDTNTLLLVLLSILIPPLAVYLHEGDTNNRFWISVLLTVIGYVLFGFAGIFFLGSLPGIIYSLIVVLGS